MQQFENILEIWILKVIYIYIYRERERERERERDEGKNEENEELVQVPIEDEKLKTLFLARIF